MLLELVVENYAVVERVRVRFGRGLNLLTGETGSGKSILVDALSLLYGGRASADTVRSGADRSRVSAIFEAPSSPEFRGFLDRHGLETEESELLLEREIQSNGKSRAFISSRPVTAAVLRELAPFLGDIHGQHDQQELFLPDSQLELLDAFAQSANLLSPLAAVHQRWRQTSEALEELDRSEQEKLRLADLWRFQRQEIEDAALSPNEDANLEAERRILLNVARLQESASSAYDVLYDAESSALSLIRQARRRLEDLCRIDGSLQDTCDALTPAEIAITEAAHNLSHYLGKLESDPARLESVESRLALIEKLKRKYGHSVEEILAFLGTVRGSLVALETTSERRAQLDAERAQLARDYETLAAQLSRLRQDAARKLEKAVKTELASLAMAGTEFTVGFESTPWSPRGIDRIRFLVSANTGELPRPLEKVASGGELSRLALALKTCTALRPSGARDAVPRTLVFDEVDTGIGGRTAEAVARRLKKLSTNHQVLCVTHLPQIAAYADQHFAVEKKSSNGRTIATIDSLSSPGRTREIARMLSGDQLTQEALKHAEQLIKSATRPLPDQLQ
ncbi:MAG: DNA repair protein RecN [Bryobacterales bacterium]|nr:DNA repair protein RecN [Bryobacterales bacterium]